MTLPLARRLFGAMSFGIAMEVGRRFGSKAGMSVLFVTVLILLVIVGLTFPDAFDAISGANESTPVAAQPNPGAIMPGGMPADPWSSIPAGTGGVASPIPLQNAVAYQGLDPSQVIPVRWTPRPGCAVLPRGQGAAAYANTPTPVGMLNAKAAGSAYQARAAQTAPLEQPSPPNNGAAPNLPPFQEAHWQGVELIPLTPALAKLVKVPSTVKGVIADDVTLPADVQGFQAGDVFMAVGGIPTPDLESFISASEQVRDLSSVEVQIWRKGTSQTMVLAALKLRLGTANGETAPMIKPGSRPPHGYNGPCTQCHRIGSTGQLPVDQGDLLSRKAPPILLGQTPPHRNRGECTACHKIIQ
jgi:hypothetical protein